MKDCVTYTFNDASDEVRFAAPLNEGQFIDLLHLEKLMTCVVGLTRCDEDIRKAVDAAIKNFAI